MIDKHLGHGYSSGIPLGAGDRYYSQDLGRDFWYLLDKTGQAISDIIDGRTKFLISGGVVSQGAGTTLNITAGVSYAPYTVTVPDTFATIPPTTKTEDVSLVRVTQAAQTNLAIPSAVADSVTVNYVKVKYLEATLNSRTKSKKAGSWAYEVTPSYLITVDSVAPTAYEVCLGTFLLTGGGAFTFSTTLRTFDYSLYNFEVLSAASAATNAVIAVMQALPEGGMYNGKIAVSVASNNITLALKTIAGTDASASNPIYVRIAGVVRTITAALSVTKNAGTNWCNSGGAELATRETDYFVYLGYNATDGVVIGFSRIPFARQYNDFSVTTTDEKYCAISTITTAASTDYYENIGRIAATLSAGAGYTWSIPTFTAINLIQRPIYESRVLQWTTVQTGWSALGTYNCYYKLIGDLVTVQTDVASPSTSNATTATLTFPFKSKYITYGNIQGLAMDNGAWCDCKGESGAGSNNLSFFKSPGLGTWTASARKEVMPNGSYFI